jgi:hypothetical protein
MGGMPYSVKTELNFEKVEGGINLVVINSEIHFYNGKFPIGGHEYETLLVSNRRDDDRTVVSGHGVGEIDNLCEDIGFEYFVSAHIEKIEEILYQYESEISTAQK